MNQELLLSLCREQTGKEEAIFTDLLAKVGQVRAALVTGDWQSLGTALQALHDGAAVHQLRTAREHFRQNAALILGEPSGSITLERLCVMLPASAAESVLAGRARVRQLGHAIQQLNQANAVLIHVFLDFFQRFFLALSGCPDAPRYGPDGVLKAPECGSLIQARG